MPVRFVRPARLDAWTGEAGRLVAGAVATSTDVRPRASTGPAAVRPCAEAGR